jgi:hypothetical protein
MDPKDWVAIFSFCVTTGIALYNWRATRFRAKLKDDLDILKRYREEFTGDPFPGETLATDTRYLVLRDKIRHRMRKAYVERRTDFSDIATAVAFVAAAVAVGLWFGDARWAIAIVLLCTAAAFVFIGLAYKDDGTERVPLAPSKNASGANQVVESK